MNTREFSQVGEGGAWGGGGSMVTVISHFFLVLIKILDRIDVNLALSALISCQSELTSIYN